MSALPLAASEPIVSWSGLGLVALFAIVAGTVIVGAFSLALVGLDRWAASRAEATDGGGSTTAPTPQSGATDVTEAARPIGVSRPQVAYGSLAMAIIGLAICVFAVVAGVASMVFK